MKNQGKWLFIKIYTGTGDPYLLDVIVEKIVVPSLKLFEQYLVNWFFIRYFDENGLHIRLRFLLEEQLHDEVKHWFDTEAISILKNINQYETFSLKNSLPLPKFPDGKLVICTDNYEPELERYGGPKGIEIAHEIFMSSSNMALEILKEERMGNIDRFQIGLLLMKEKVDLICTNDIEANQFLEDYSFISSGENSEIDHEFINNAVEKNIKETKESLYKSIRCSKSNKIILPYLALLRERYTDIKLIDRPVTHLIKDYIHMTNNRLGISIYEEAYFAKMLIGLNKII